MNWFTRTVSSSVGKKVVMGLTGLGLVFFLATHLAGNLLLYAGNEAYDHYAHALHSNPFLPVIELGLLALFVLHLFLAVTLTLANRKARGGQSYAVNATKRDDLAWPSANMFITGSVILGFVLLHLADMRFNLRGFHQEGVSPAQTTLAVLKNPISFLVYLIGSLFLAPHVFHGFESAFRSVGIRHPKYTPALLFIGKALAVIFALGFASLPIWALLFK